MGCRDLKGCWCTKSQRWFQAGFYSCPGWSYPLSLVTMEISMWIYKIYDLIWVYFNLTNKDQTRVQTSQPLPDVHTWITELLLFYPNVIKKNSNLTHLGEPICVFWVYCGFINPRSAQQIYGLERLPDVWRNRKTAQKADTSNKSWLSHGMKESQTVEESCQSVCYLRETQNQLYKSNKVLNDLLFFQTLELMRKD